MSGGGDPSTPALRPRLYDAAAGLLCLVAFAAAWQKTRGLTWPCESDLYRDMGTAQTLLDGRLGEDPGYLGERWWYPPLVPALVGAASFVAGTTVHEAFATFGAVFNLLAPAGFYVLAARLLGRGAGLAALVAFLFFGQHDLMSWLHATYSPWLWPCNLAQGFFYFALFALLGAFESRKLWVAGFAGTLAGLTFLAHAAPGLLLGVVLLVLAFREAFALRRDRPGLVSLLRRIGVVAGLAVLVAAPFALAPLVHYGGKVRNPVPLTWLAGELAVANAGALAGRLVSVRGLVALVGLVGLFWPRLLARPARWALGSWLVFVGLGLAYGYAAQLRPLPPLFPSWHFYFYAQAFEAVAFGVGALSLARLVERIASRLLERFTPRLRVTADRFLDIAVAGLLVLALVRWKGYAERPDLVANRAAAIGNAQMAENELYAWILKNTDPSDVVLGDTQAAAFVAAAGRKVIWLNPIFSNPYVKIEPRSRDGEALLAALRDQRAEEFRKLAKLYRVRYVAIRADQRKRFAAVVPSLLKRRLRTKHKTGYDVYAVVNLP